MHVVQNWRINGQRYALKGTQCPRCGKVSFPTREVCQHCQQENNASAKIVAEPAAASIAWQRAAR